MVAVLVFGPFFSEFALVLLLDGDHPCQHAV